MTFFKKFYDSRWFPYLAIVTLGVLVYYKALFFELTYLDDNVWIIDYHWYLKDPTNIYKFFLQHDLVSPIFYRPILNVTFLINAQLGGVEPFYYHLTNLIVHLINSCLVYVFIRKFGYSRNLAVSFSLIFAVHPVLTASVAWIPGRTDSIIALFVFSSFICFLSFLEKRKLFYFIGHLVLLVGALLSKETAIVLPVLCFLYFHLISDKKNLPLKQWVLYLIWAVIIVGWFIVRNHFIVTEGNLGLVDSLKTIIPNSSAIISYWGKIFLPGNLSVLPIVKDIRLSYGVMAVVLVFGGYLFSKHSRNKYVLFGFVWFLFFLLPSLVLSFLKHEYRIYIPMLGGLIVLLELDIVRFLEKKPSRLFIFTVGSLVIFSIMTFRYSHHYKNRMTYWESAAKTSPHSPLAHRNLGAMYFLEESYDDAALEFQKSLELNPYEQMAHNNLGLIYMNQDQLKEAEIEFRKEIAINPNYDNVYFNYGLLLYRQNRFKEAEASWKKTLELNPKYIDAYRHLAVHFFNLRDYVKARYYTQELEKRGIDIPQEWKKILNSK